MSEGAGKDMSRKEQLRTAAGMLKSGAAEKDGQFATDQILLGIFLAYGVLKRDEKKRLREVLDRDAMDDVVNQLDAFDAKAAGAL